ncbi:MAG TPA: metallopeptidase TldD-related protein [Gemmatimonadaceae bacterium]|jgi:predicted Zn-dependent protease|nr:metallopeptidase TldD-related protein [Gemmatimonadaceae bacterium]
MNGPMTPRGPLSQRQPTPSARPPFLSEADCQEIAHRFTRYAVGGGYTTVAIRSTWRGNVRWARNQISTAGDVRNDDVFVNRNIHGAHNIWTQINEITDDALVAAARRAERLARLGNEVPDADLAVVQFQPEPFTALPLFVEATYQLNASRRAEAARQLAHAATAAGMLSAGYIEVSAQSMALISSVGWARYFQWTWAQYSVTVRDPMGTGSGWAGVDWADWSKINGEQLSAIALAKCLTSRSPVAIEPGRYTTILEPQAVCDFITKIVNVLGREPNERSQGKPFSNTPGNEPGGMFNAPENFGMSRLGERVVDERLTIRSDPTDPELASVPFKFLAYDSDGEYMLPQDILHPVTWIERGVLAHLSEEEDYAVKYLDRATGMTGNGSFRISVTGEMVSVQEMIATTKRGLLVTRFDQVLVLDYKSFLCRGYTRDGLWLIENGTIVKPVINMAFTESVLFALNNVEQLGAPQHAFHPPGNDFDSVPSPVIVPPMKIKDFSFTALADSI